MDDKILRTHLADALGWHEAHVDFERATADLPAAARGKAPAGLPYSPWQVVEHIRRAQRDILEFCTRPDYHELDWPDDYWPTEAAPPHDAAWEQAVRDVARDRAALQAMVRDAHTALDGKVPHGKRQTYLREVLLVLDHTAYHVGELIVMRRLLGAWPAES